MSLPRALRLVETSKGLRVAAQVPAAARNAIAASTFPGTYLSDLSVDLAVGEEMAIALFGENDPHFILSRTHMDQGTVRTRRAPCESLDHFAHDYLVDLAWPESGSLDLTLFVDRGLVELYAADGLVWITNLFYPIDVSAPMTVTPRKIDHDLSPAAKTKAGA
ncbi:GH32 C-terminal domain-containing protein [Devosia ginsengisoli]|uniref:GH32 C-terminal domain-containing protein n=1 Tax=Devosia ginsengisoli TaxID=400770 RepID=UPI0026F15718|nr:GH32 C-terminal domain-containing protein [Devosia ginsengisoli]MCR6670730.1 GH32 C-terminal domain-containing protein [Devosia ginsengisoli]